MIMMMMMMMMMMVLLTHTNHHHAFMDDRTALKSSYDGKAALDCVTLLGSLEVQTSDF